MQLGRLCRAALRESFARSGSLQLLDQAVHEIDELLRVIVDLLNRTGVGNAYAVLRILALSVNARDAPGETP